MGDSSSNSSNGEFIDHSSLYEQFNEDNCRKRRRTLESEIDRTSMEMKLIKDKFDLQNDLMEQLDENKRIIDANNKLSELLEKSNIENETLKKENEKILEELNKNKNLEKDCENIISENTQLLLKIKSLNSKLSNIKEDLNLKELDKLKEELDKSTKINENILKEKNELAKEFEKFKSENKINEKLISENTQLNIKMDFIKSEIKNSKIREELNLKELDKLKEELQKSKETNENLSKEKLILNILLENLKIDEAKIKEENKSKTTQLDNYKRTVQDLISQKDKLVKELEKLNIELEMSNTELEKFNVEVTKLKNQLVLNTKLVRLVNLTNRINDINDQFTCCSNKCINSNLANGTCTTGNGFIRINEDGIIKYHLSDGKDDIINFYTQHSFKKAWGYCCYYSLFYFEITMIEETKDRTCYAAFGFDDISPKMFLHNGLASTIFNLREKEKFYRKYSWKDKDVFGYGVVFPPWKDKKILPYIFFTKNGARLGKVSMEEGDDNLRPFFELLSCSIEINFGNDLENKPFRYNIHKHNI